MHTRGDTQGGTSSDVLRLSRSSISICRSTLQNPFRDESVNLKADMGNESSRIVQHHHSPLVQYLQVCSNHIDLLSDTVLSPSPRPLCAIPPGDMPYDIFCPIGTRNAGKEIFNPEADISCHSLEYCVNSPLKRFKCSSSTANGTSRVKPSIRILDDVNTNATSNSGKVLYPIEDDEHMKDHVVPLIEYTSPVIEEQSASMSRNGENNKVSKGRSSHEDWHHAAVPLPAVTTPSGEGIDQTRTNDRLRRARISEGIKALQNSVPCSDKGNRESVMDDTIDYIKFLKLQLQVLSQSRLSGEASTYPFVYLEGYGHYLLHQHALNEPLEEIMGQLMELNMEATRELLRSKGLAFLPMDLAYTLLHSS